MEIIFWCSGPSIYPCLTRVFNRSNSKSTSTSSATVWSRRWRDLPAVDVRSNACAHAQRGFSYLHGCFRALSGAILSSSGERKANRGDKRRGKARYTWDRDRGSERKRERERERERKRERESGERRTRTRGAIEVRHPGCIVDDGCSLTCNAALQFLRLINAL